MKRSNENGNFKVNINKQKGRSKGKQHCKHCKGIKGQTLILTGAIVFRREESDEETGEVKTTTACAIKSKDNNFYSSISQTVLKSLDTILETFEQSEIEQGIEIAIKTSKSNKGREFFFIDLV